MTQTIYIDELLKDDRIIALMKKSNEFYWLSAVSVRNEEYSNDELTSICRLILVITNYALVCEDNEYAEKAYKTLKSIKISNPNTCEIFDSIVGCGLTNSSLVYYFYLSSLALKLNKTISARLDLAEFNGNSTVEESNWSNRVLSGIFKSLILLIRKANGFSDIKDALNIISRLRQEQETFEEHYIAELNYSEQTSEALSLVSLYHTSKALTETAEYLIQGYEYPKRIDAVVRQHIDIALKLQRQDTRLLDFVNFIWKDLQILIQNSIWTGTAFHDKIKRLCQLKSRNNILELLPSQRQALNENLFNVAANAIILQMPTSAGKTLLAEFNIIVTKSLRNDARIVYIVPSRALVNQVYFDLREDLSEFGIKVEKTSSANEIDPTENDFLLSDDIDVLVSTPEKVDLLIRRRHSSVDDVSLFIIDEAHSIENGQRGARLELLVAMLRRERPNAKYMLLSPFLPGNKDSLKDWLGGGNTIQVDWKPSDKVVIGLDVKTKYATIETLPSPYCSSSIPVAKYKISPLVALSSEGKKSKILEFACKYFATQGKTQLILCAGRGSANSKAKSIAEWIDNPTVISDDVRLVQKYMNEEIGCETLFTQLLSKGVTVHHAGLSDESKLLIEHLIRNKRIQYVCSTSTIAEGVNFPVSSVYFDSYERGSGNRFSSNDFWNIAGRAGRTMVDDFGKIILPFNSKENKQTGLDIIQHSAEELTSVLAELFIQQDIVREQLSQDDNGIYNLLRLYPDSFGPLFQYFVHLLNVSHNEYVEDVEDLFKDSLAYHMLSSEDRRAQFIDLCRYIYQSIELKFSHSLGALKFADKTGFSVPSVLQIMHEKANSSDISDLDSWQPQNIFNRHNPQSLAQKIKVIAALRETNLGTESKSAPLNPELIAKMIIGWVKGDKLNAISTIHPYFQSEQNTDKRVADFVNYMNGVRFKASWGLSALEGIVKGVEDELKDSYIPSFVYYGVDDKKSLAMRMMGVPRSLSKSLSQIIDGQLSDYSFSKLRNRIKSLSSQDWDGLKPRTSSLTGDEWSSIIKILMK